MRRPRTVKAFHRPIQRQFSQLKNNGLAAFTKMRQDSAVSMLARAQILTPAQYLLLTCRLDRFAAGND
jgi:hypothetical protein